MNKKKFAQGLSFYKIFLFFVLGSIFGCFFEEIQWFVQNKYWTCRHDLLYGPFSTLYGFGLIIFLIILEPKSKYRGIFKTFIYAFFIGGILEYLAAVLTNKFFNIQFWDYSNMFLNIKGKTTIPIMIIWGIMGVILLKIIYPFISRWIEAIPIKIGVILSNILIIFLAFDMFLSYTVFARMIYRNNGTAPLTFIGKFYDEKYNDDYMYNKYPILKDKVKKQ